MDKTKAEIAKEKYLNLKDYHEFMEKREQFEDLELDDEVREKMRELFPNVPSGYGKNGEIIEAF